MQIVEKNQTGSVGQQSCRKAERGSRTLEILAVYYVCVVFWVYLGLGLFKVWEVRTLSAVICYALCIVKLFNEKCFYIQMVLSSTLGSSEKAQQTFQKIWLGSLAGGAVVLYFLYLLYLGAPGQAEFYAVSLSLLLAMSGCCFGAVLAEVYWGRRATDVQIQWAKLNFGLVLGAQLCALAWVCLGLWLG
ncbi:hypothetical protein NEHOM01_2049 [Nematocida homosporus]|uniref:uncharacterized protein n=1 Tax=Nematocida homosporus TaxID=1912981 RepID=UPI00221FF43D|nr:uncharacterized protein NEHOM01_2049 [Nematocida homosporus]KAI5187258.1 hypothetical protein NEHOM01_2049 [Nematocida homosporus]